MPKASGWHRKRQRTPGELAGRYSSAEHQAARRALKALVAAGQAVCWRCGTRTSTKWHVGHDDAGTRLMGPECMGCNVRAAASKGARVANARRKARREAEGFQRPTR